MKRNIRHFLNSDLYLILFALYTFFNWFYKFDYRISIVIATLFVILITLVCDNSKPLVPVILSLLFCDIFNYGDNRWNVTEIVESIDYVFIAIFALIDLAFLIYFYIKHKRKMPNKSLIGISLIVIFISFMLTDIFIKRSINFLLIGLLIIVFYFFRHTTNLYTVKSKELPYYAKAFYHFGVMIAFQVFTYYLFNFDLEINQYFNPVIGWANSNNVSLVLLLIMPIGAYTLFIEEKPIYLLGILIMFTGNFLTLSRGGIVASFVLIILLLLNNYRKFHDRKKFNIGISIVVIYLLTGFLLFSPYILKLLEHLLESGFGDSGRFNLWKEAWNQFIKSPFLGGGTILVPDGGIIAQGWYHSTFFDVLGQLGIVGLLSFGFHFVIKYITTLSNRSVYKWFAFIGFVSSGLYALIDVAYFNFNYLLIYVIILATIEISGGYISKEKND